MHVLRSVWLSSGIGQIAGSVFLFLYLSLLPHFFFHSGLCSLRCLWTHYFYAIQALSFRNLRIHAIDSLENWNGRMRFIVIMRLFELFPLNILISKNRMYRMSKMCYFLMDLIFVAVVQLGAFTISWKLEFGQSKPTKSPYQELNILCVRKCVSHISDQAFAIVRAVNEDLNFIGSYHWFLWLSSKLTEYHSVHPIFFSSPKKFIILWKYQIFHEIIFIGWWSKLFV